MRPLNIRTMTVAATIAISSLTMVACTTTQPGLNDAPRMDSTSINTRANAALERLYESVPGSKELVARSAGVLVFPSVIGGSFVIGAEHGRGVLRVGTTNKGYYATTAASIGWQAGGQSKAVIYVFNTKGALNEFLKGDGWSVGGDASVALGRVGANGSLDSTTATTPVTSFVLTNVGLEAGVSLQGARITPVKNP
ncbi:twin-arginine translocation pathway signal [Lampropedia puyangensis]|uniref:Twin-arginine translocation pathway signal n=1 Tax=Lampropedia puyangensis TaxID=1330072 RepID=A0A4S8F2B4_9BURK|nr:YSC84-related protein [Lampropedia puyangensis]THT99281.1 twin-arginine translocation pathway signal [Lampropedia puyangensis]